VTAALKAEGFGVLTQIDVQATLKQKLDVDFRRYIILGACNPPFAHRAFTTELEIGLLLPCNVIVYEDERGAGSVVSIINPIMLGTGINPTLASVGEEAAVRLRRVLDGHASGLIEIEVAWSDPCTREAGLPRPSELHYGFRTRRSGLYLIDPAPQNFLRTICKTLLSVGQYTVRWRIRPIVGKQYRLAFDNPVSG
jgi:uncharacterized protein (DUF302 family)